jgi:hypothetical protein
MLDVEILKLASMEIEMDAAPNDELMKEWKRGFAACSFAERTLLRIAYKMLTGKPYLIFSDNSDHLARYRAFAERLGAEVVDHCRHPLFDFDHGLDQILILPQSHH